jgi:5'-nucleotidase (lipoprotein e(P4) family)
MRTRRTYLISLVLFTFLVPTSLFPQSREGQPHSDTEYLEGAVLWQQTSGERRALSYQAFNLARMMLDRDLRMNRKSRQRRAIIVDLDETIIDNIRNQARMVKDGAPFTPDSFTAWANRAECTAIPGALEFLRYANSRGVRVFYITNRKQNEREGTMRNLRNLGFPNVNDETLMIRPSDGNLSKEPRRLAVSAKYRVVLLMGDDLNDFAAVFENNQTIDGRLAAADRNRKQFGTQFIVLPNPMYGNWESVLYDYNFKLTEAQKAEKRRAALKPF